MVKAYKIVKIVLAAILTFFIVIVIVYESRMVTEIDFEKPGLFRGIAETYLKMKETLFYDPYNSAILDNVTYFEKRFADMFAERITAVSNFVEDPRFDSQLLAFAVFKRANGNDFNVRKYFGDFPDFKDLILIDEEKNVIFKYGSETFSVQYYHLSNRIMATNFENLYGIIYRRIDRTLEYDYEIVSLFDYSLMTRELQNTRFPAFVFINDTLLRNKQFNKNLFTRYQGEHRSRKRYRIGLNHLKIIPLQVGSNYLGYAGIMYPVRSATSYLLIFLKIIVIGGVIFLLVIGDRALKRLWKRLESDKEAIESTDLSELKPKEEEDPEEKSLDWVEHYIHDIEAGKK